MKKLILLFITLLLSFFLIISCDKNVDENDSDDDIITNIVSISESKFVPSTITITAGSTVTWINQDMITHTVTQNESLFDSGYLRYGDKFEFTFNTKGTFEYYCKYHPGTTGFVIVE